MSWIPKLIYIRRPSVQIIGRIGHKNNSQTLSFYHRYQARG